MICLQICLNINRVAASLDFRGLRFHLFVFYDGCTHTVMRISQSNPLNREAWPNTVRITYSLCGMPPPTQQRYYLCVILIDINKCTRVALWQ